MTEAEGAGEVRDLITQLRAEDYIADRGLATSLFLALQLGKPLLLEGAFCSGPTQGRYPDRLCRLSPAERKLQQKAGILSCMLQLKLV